MQPFYDGKIKQAIRILDQGGVIAYPTEAVYGLGCDPLYGPAVIQILNLKQRSIEKGLILIAACFEQLLPYIQVPNANIETQLQTSWPGPVTWLLPVRPNVPAWLRGKHKTLAVRVTDHPIAKGLCQQFEGAIVSTSANISGRPPARNILTARRIFGNKIDAYLNGKAGTLATPTEIRDATNGAIIRSS